MKKQVYSLKIDRHVIDLQSGLYGIPTQIAQPVRDFINLDSLDSNHPAIVVDSKHQVSAAGMIT